MLQNTTTSINHNSLMKRLQESGFYNDSTSNQLYKLGGNLTDQSVSYPLNKLENLHPNPSLSRFKDDTYQTAKKVKGNEREYNMLRNDKENYYSQMIPDQRVQDQVMLDYSFRAPVLDQYQPITYPVSEYDFPMNQVLLQNLYNNVLIEAEILRRYNELQELSRIQNLENTLLPENFTTMFLLSLQEKQKQDFYNLQLLQEAQQRLGSSLINVNGSQAGIQNMEAIKSNEKKNLEPIVVSDDDESWSSLEVSVGKNFPENESKDQGLTMKQEYIVQEPEGQYARYDQKNVVSTPESYDSDATSIKKKKNKTAKVGRSLIAAEANILPKPRAANRWQLEKEYQEQLRVEAEKPYFIDVHIDPENHDQKIIKTAVGKAHQTKVPAYKLNNQGRSSRRLKPVWRPDIMGEGKFEEGFARIEMALGEKIENQEKAVKLLVSFGMNIETVINEIEKNLIFYKNYFKTNPRMLRKRQTNV